MWIQDMNRHASIELLARRLCRFVYESHRWFLDDCFTRCLRSPSLAWALPSVLCDLPFALVIVRTHDRLLITHLTTTLCQHIRPNHTW
jgi:hypothetical protein